jgi:hypothetical protein
MKNQMLMDELHPTWMEKTLWLNFIYELSYKYPSYFIIKSTALNTSSIIYLGDC